MKRIILCVLIIFGCLLQRSEGQTYGWVKLNLDSIPGDPFFQGLYFTSSDTGWITSDIDSTFNTVDGGIVFSLQATAFGNTNAVFMLDANYGYCGGQGGWVYRTMDGGLNWNVFNTMGSELLDISFPPGTNPNNPVGYACGGNGQVWRIDSSMTNLNTGLATSFSGISAPSVNNVWFCGGNRIYYYNGATFTSQSHPSGTFNDVYMINNMEGWAVGDAGIISHTTTGGVPYWIGQNNPDTNQRSLYGVFALNSNVAWAVGNQGIILHTSNAGATWNIESDGLTNNDLHQVFFTSPTNGYVTGAHKTILKFTQLTSIEEKEQISNIYIYPNPTDKIIRFEIPFNQQLEFAIISDMTGREIIRKDNFCMNEISLVSLHNGFYSILIVTNKQRYFGKIIKN